MIVGLFLLVLAAGAIAAGVGYVRAARRMRGFAVARGRVVGREVTTLPTCDRREGVWGSGGGSMPKVTYTYEVDGRTYTSDRWSYAYKGLKRAVAQRMADAVPDEVDVHYNPADPAEAYLETNSATAGVLITGLGVLMGLGGLVGVLS